MREEIGWICSGCVRNAGRVLHKDIRDLSKPVHRYLCGNCRSPLELVTHELWQSI